MNNMKRVVTLVFITLFLCAGHVNGQPRTRTFESQNRFLTVNGVTIAIDKLAIVDSIAPGSKLVHLADFDFPVRNSADFKSVIRDLQSGVQSNKTVNAIVSIANANFEIMEERSYTDAAVQVIVMPELDASSKELVRISVKIKATTLQIAYDTKVKIKTTAQQGAKGITAANWKADFGKSQPSGMIVKINDLCLGNSTNQPQNFSIEVAGADMKLWHQWLMTDASKKVQGTIELLGPDMKEILLQIDIPDVEIISFVVKYNNTQTLSRAIVGLRAMQVSIR